MQAFDFEHIELNNLVVPKFSFLKDEFFRIELNFSLNSYKKKIIQQITKLVEAKGFKKVTYIKRQNFISKIFKPWTVKYYLTHICKLDNNKIIEFFQMVRKYHHQNLENENIYNVDNAFRRVILLRGIIAKNNFLVIDTAGMYVSALIISYILIKELYENDGSCLEITYPPFPSYELDKYIGRKVKSIIIGENTL